MNKFNPSLKPLRVPPSYRPLNPESELREKAINTALARLNDSIRKHQPLGNMPARLGRVYSPKFVRRSFQVPIHRAVDWDYCRAVPERW